MAEMEILQRGRRVRPEDIDLPDMTSAPQAGEDGAQSAANGHAEQASAEDEKAQKRRKFLAAQLKSSKKVTESKKEESASPKEPTKRTTNPLAAEKHKSRSSSKTKRDQSSSPESKHGRKSADKKKDKKKKHHKEKKVCVAFQELVKHLFFRSVATGAIARPNRVARTRTIPTKSTAGASTGSSPRPRAARPHRLLVRPTVSLRLRSVVVTGNVAWFPPFN